MRKYIQLLLVVAAVASVCLMLLYERKYMKMKMILEILNGFNYKETTSLQPRSSLQPTQEAYFVSNPSWTYLTDSLYLYSAYWQNGSESNDRTALVLATSSEPVNLYDLHCYLWYEDQPGAVMGKVQVKKYSSDSSPFIISCSHLGMALVPYGICVSYKTTNSSFLPVMTFIKNFQMATCLETLPIAFQDTLLLAEFLIFHQNAGVDYFVIYEKGLSPGTRKLLERAKNSGYHIDVLHWNYPTGKPGYDAQILDCFARSFLLLGVNTVATLKLGQFLVPKGSGNLTDAIRKSVDVSCYKFDTYHFCSEYPIDVVAETLNFPFVTLMYTKRLTKETKSPALVYRNNIANLWNYRKNESTRLVPGNDVLLHVYGNCHLHQLNMKYSEDVTMTYYKNLFFSSPLYHYIENEPGVLNKRQNRA